MWNKIMPGVKRWVSRYLVVAMMMTFVFSNSFACSVFAAPDEGGERAATASDAIRDSRVKLLNKGKDDVQIVVMSDSAGYEAGDTVCLELYIKNNTGKTITDGKLKYSGGKILEDSAYFEDLSAMYEEEEFQEERSEEQDMMPADSKSPVLESALEQMEEEAEAALERLELEAEAGAEVVQKALEGAAKAEEEAKVLENDSEQGEEEEMDDTPDHLENLVIQPGQSYYVNFYYTIDDEIKGIKGQTLNFSFRGKTEEGKQVSGKESFRYTIGALNLRPVVFAEGSRLLTGEEHEMVLDFDIGELQEILEEAELEAIDREGQKEEETAGEETASLSEGRPASASQADGKGNSASYKGSKASDSDGLKDTPSNTWAQWGENDSQNLGKKDEQPLISRLNCQVETYGVKLNGFKIKGFTEEDDVNYGTSVTCKFRVSKNTVPGTYYGKVTASYKYKGRDCKSTQGFQIVVAGEGEVTLSSEVNGTEVIVSGPAEYFPEAEDLEIQVAEADEEQQMQVMEALQKKAEEEGTQIKDYRAFDIKLMADGEETEPGGKLKVTFKNVKLEANAAEEAALVLEDESDAKAAVPGQAADGAEDNIQVYHLDEDAVEVNEMVTTTEERGDVVMTETDHFSVYVVVLENTKELYDVTFQHYTGIGADFGTYEKTYRDSWPTDKDNNRVKLGGDGEYRYTAVSLDPFVEAIQKTGCYQAKTIKVFSMDHDTEGNEVLGEETQESKEGVYANIFSGSDQKIEIQQDTIIRIYYEKTTNNEEKMMKGVTFYDYDKGDNGINSDSNYPENWPANKRLAVSLSAPWEAMVEAPKKGQSDEKNANTNNSNEYPIIQGIITGLDSQGNPEFGNGLADPGFFTIENKTGKHIYPTDIVNTGLQFKRTGEHYKLDYAVLDVPTNYVIPDKTNLVIPEITEENGRKVIKTKAGTKQDENQTRFYPLDFLVDADQKDTDPSNGGDYKDSENKPHNWYFGMRYEFTINVGNYIGPLDYAFSGDDDLWVFLDGRLVLDLGGEHSTYPDRYSDENRAWRNHVNLWWYLNDSNADYASYDENLEKAEQAKCDLSKTYGSHKITILYMERGGQDSGCDMEFSMPGLEPVQVTPIRGDQTIAVKKIWKDFENPYRPEKIKIQLQRKAGDNSWENLDEPIVLNESNQWSYQWKVDMNGYSYRVIESQIPGYEVSYSDIKWNDVTNQYEITITNELDDIRLAKIIKNWNDENNQDGNRPESVAMQLYWKKVGDDTAEWKKYTGKKLVLNGQKDEMPTPDPTMGEDKEWEGTFTDLPAYMYDSQGRAFLVEYRVFELDSSGNGIEQGGKLEGKNKNLDSYEVSYSVEEVSDKQGSVTTVNNRYTPKKISQKVIKVWKNIPEGIPVTAEIGLYSKSGNEYQLVNDLPDVQGKKQENPIPVSSEKLEYTWSNLPAYKNGQRIEYKVFEHKYQENGEKKYIDEPGDKDWVLAEDGYLYQLEYDEVSGSPGTADTTTTITNTLQTAMLRVKKVVSNEGQKEPEDFSSNYKFLIEVKDGGRTYTTVALKDGDISKVIIVPFTEKDISTGKTFTIRETVPMEYALDSIGAGDFIEQFAELPDDEAQEHPWSWDPQNNAITLKPGADVIVTVINKMEHKNYFHHTASVTNEKKADSSDEKWNVGTAPFKDAGYTESHGMDNNSSDPIDSKQIAFEVPYAEEDSRFKEKILDEEVALYG